MQIYNNFSNILLNCRSDIAQPLVILLRLSFLKIAITSAIFGKSGYVCSLKQTLNVSLKNLEITGLAYSINLFS